LPCPALPCPGAVAIPELRRVWKEAAVAGVELSHHLPGETEEKYGKPQDMSVCQNTKHERYWRTISDATHAVMVCEIEPRVSLVLAFDSGTGEHWPSNLNVFFGGTGKLLQHHDGFKMCSTYKCKALFTIVVWKACIGIYVCLKTDCTQNVCLCGVIFLTNAHIITAIWISYISKQVFIFSFCLTLAKLNKCTYKGPSDKILFLHEAICKIHTLPLAYQ
jgi:hypothetical protein